MSDAIEKIIKEVQQIFQNTKHSKFNTQRLAWMFANWFPNTLETTVHYREVDGEDDTFVYTGDIPAMWLYDSGAQVWPYVQFANHDVKLQKMIRRVIIGKGFLK